MADKIILRDVAYGNHERHTVDIFIPEKTKCRSGVILYIHGGGWHSGNKSDHHFDCEHFCNLGYITASMNYRFVTEELSVADELDDITCALQTIKSKSAEHNLDLQKIIFSGGSAGAHLSLLYAYTRYNESPVTPAAVCAYCPPVDCAQPDFLLGISGEFESWKYEILSKCASCKITKDTLLSERQQTALKNISPACYVSQNCVPTAIFHGRNDELIPLEHIYNFIGKLEKAEVKNDFLLFENSGHNLNKDPDTHSVARKIIEEYADMYF